MEETQEENSTGLECETEHDEENSDNGNDEQSDDDNRKSCDDDNKNDVNSAKNLFLFTEVNSLIDLLTKKFKNPL